jgi:23S rRNA pseudouridine1911/1915/1917 synthase
MKINLHIDESQYGKRLDTTLSNLVETCSRNRSISLITSGNIRVNDYKKKPGYKVKSGDHITGDIPDLKPEDTRVVPEDIKLDIIHEDDQIMVINKNPGMVVHPAPGNLTGTVVNALLFHYPQIKNVGEDYLRSGIVHRLDKDTSGLMVVAKTKHALGFLQKEFKNRRVGKKYLALIAGNPEEDHGEINLPIGRHPVKRKLMTVNHENGKSARTLWKVIKRMNNYCLVEADLKTGRTHQIRVHFYAMDHSLVGDPVHQPRRMRKKQSIAPRQMLHSHKLSFRHPYSGVRLSFKTELPEDFIDMQTKLESM